MFQTSYLSYMPTKRFPHPLVIKLSSPVPLSLSEKQNKLVFFSECLLRHRVLHILCRSVCWFLYGPVCHGFLKLDISTMFTTFFL